jgi:apolipoprotein N-acyltransferase
VLLAPAWDFGPDGWLHSRMAIWRGVESGFTVVRAAKQGQLVVSDAYGRVLAEAASTAEGFARLSTSAPARHVPTLYSRWGDWFGWLAVAIVVACIGRLIVTLAAQRSAVTPSRRAIPSLPS